MVARRCGVCVVFTVKLDISIRRFRSFDGWRVEVRRFPPLVCYGCHRGVLAYRGVRVPGS
jgi:hypothetical protein